VQEALSPLFAVAVTTAVPYPLAPRILLELTNATEGLDDDLVMLRLFQQPCTLAR